MSYDEWRNFFNRDTYTLSTEWTNLLIPHLVSIGITCTPIFDYHHAKKKHSRKKRGHLIVCTGHCKKQKCSIVFQIYVGNESIKKRSTTLFTVHTMGVENHEPKEEIASRPVTGLAREKMGIAATLSFSHYLKYIYLVFSSAY
jgi:hypothetical protein